MSAKIAAAVKALKACIAAFDTLARYQIHVEPHHPESPKNQAITALALLEAAQEEGPLDHPALLEELAAIEHERWSGWERYREKCVAQVRRGGDIETHEERWLRQRETPYASLAEREKESDRVEARKSLAVVKEHVDQLRRERDELRGKRDDLAIKNADYLLRMHEAEKQRDEAVELLRSYGDMQMDMATWERELDDFLATLKGSGEG